MTDAATISSTHHACLEHDIAPDPMATDKRPQIRGFGGTRMRRASENPLNRRKARTEMLGFIHPNDVINKAFNDLAREGERGGFYFRL